MSKQTLAVMVLLCVAGGCKPARPQGPVYDRLQAEDPSVRIEAIRQAADSNNTGAVPFLVDRLTDSDGDVRFFAAIALKQITGHTLGYEIYLPQEQRDQAVKRWRQWLAAGRPALPAVTPEEASVQQAIGNMAATRPAGAASQPATAPAWLYPPAGSAGAATQPATGPAATQTTSSQPKETPPHGSSPR